MIRHFDLASSSARLALLATTLLVLACAPRTRIIGLDPYEGERLPRPDRILVYDFAARAADLPPWSEAATTYRDREAAATDEDVEIARKLGYQMTKELVSRIGEMGLTVQRSIDPSEPQPGDIAIVGFLGSVDEGSGVKRVVLGFGSGAPEITSHVEGYLATETGFRKLSSGTAEAGPQKSPGAVLPIVVTLVTKNPIGLIVSLPFKVGSEVTGRSTVEGAGKQMAERIAKELEPRFRAQGWLGDQPSPP